MIKIDVIIILGGGIDKRGMISKVTKERLTRFLGDKKKFFGIPVVLSGRWSGFVKKALKITEAQAMKDYLIVNGVNINRMYLETKSLDTISNAIFSKQIVKKHRSWKRVLLITSDWHMRRALWIFKKYLGNNYRIIPFPVVSKKGQKDQRKDYEKFLLITAKSFSKSIPTNSRGLIKLLEKKHPFYSKSKKAQEILKESEAYKKIST